jgi:hypothetical protein
MRTKFLSVDIAVDVLLLYLGDCMESIELLKSNRDGVCFCHQARDNEALIYSTNVCSDRTHKTQDRYVHRHTSS